MMSFPDGLFSTYSIVARDPKTGQLGVAVQTHQMCVGRVVPWAMAGIGAVATQSAANISFGPMALTMLCEGVPAPRVIDALISSDAESHRRQVAIVDAQGQVGARTGQGCIPEAMHQLGSGYSVQANMMTNDTVVPAMAVVFEGAQGDLAHRMMAAMEAAQREGGDIRGMQSAALKVVSGDKSHPSWSSDYDLRVDEHEDPVSELARLVRLRHAQRIAAEGERAFREGDRDMALSRWATARTEAPELEELAFWQARILADEGDDVRTAADILAPAIADHPRREHWIDLLLRLEVCGLIERVGAAEELIAALG
jgi:uncharacterized Ntn-hydrolase superfamily protein